MLIGLSGGGDSSVAAYLLLQDGFQVEGFYFKNGFTDITGLFASDVHWIHRPDSFREPLNVVTKIRCRQAGAESMIIPVAELSAAQREKLPSGGRDLGAVYVKFKTCHKAVAPGQAAVFYSGDDVIGGGWIEQGVR